MPEWTAEYSQQGGYDCITSAFLIKHLGKTVLEIDRCLFDDVCEWDDKGERNSEMVATAEFIVKACNEHKKIRAALVVAVGILESMPPGILGPFQDFLDETIDFEFLNDALDRGVVPDKTKGEE